MNDEGFTGTCPTCGQEDQRARIAELEKSRDWWRDDTGRARAAAEYYQELLEKAERQLGRTQVSINNFKDAYGTRFEELHDDALMRFRVGDLRDAIRGEPTSGRLDGIPVANDRRKWDGL